MQFTRYGGNIPVQVERTRKSGAVGKPRLPLEINLLADQHLACGSEIACRERVEIHAAGDSLTKCVFAIPIGGATPVLIHPRILMSERQRPDNLPI